MVTDRQDGANRLLSAHETGFRVELARLGYADRPAEKHVDLLADLSGWLDSEGLRPGELSSVRVAEFLASRRARGYRRLVTLVGFAPLFEYLVRVEVVPQRARPVPVGPLEVALERYREYLVRERGLAEAVIEGYMLVARTFAEAVADGDQVDWARVSPGDVTRFVIDECARLHHPRMLPSALRSLLGFAQLDGWTGVALAPAVPSVAGWSASSLPRGVRREEVKRLLGSCDRRSRVGRRDYAILTLLARLGLRAGEVAAMGLDDLDWRGGEVVVHGKGRRDERLPLPADVGQAVADYLRRGRPAADSRAVFLRVAAPRRALTPQGVTWVVYNACDRAGLPRVGAHRLRHTVACELLAAGASLSEVGQVLRQRRLGTTAIYAKVDHARLAVLARPWPGGAA